mmetsp:Transcript_41811/g.110712  ORF Transcript_41811/g.110712 Transcript_41811/m.110712 type:complete len:84 (+) Transcript_41811:146-397(+)
MRPPTLLHLALEAHTSGRSGLNSLPEHQTTPTTAAATTLQRRRFAPVAAAVAVGFTFPFAFGVTVLFALTAVFVLTLTDGLSF